MWDSSSGLTANSLSRPSLSYQQPLSTPSSTLPIAAGASLAYPSQNSDAKHSEFILSPLLTLPPTFGSAYVGETFSCTLCANNELTALQSVDRRITSVRIEAEMKTPSITSALPLTPKVDLADDAHDSSNDLEPGKSLQRIVEYDLKEEGSHVLAVTVTYSETILAGDEAQRGRVRTFRKLYQFVAKQCMTVRTKTGLLPEVAGQGRRWSLEGQLENCGEETIVLDVRYPLTLGEQPG